MKRIAVFLLLGSSANAQGFIQNNTATPSNARFEVLMVNAGGDRTHLKLDRYTGEVWSISSKDARTLWIPTPVEDPLITKAADAPRFQIFAPLMQDSTILLLDCRLGTVWRMTFLKIEGGGMRWQWRAEAPPEKPAVLPPI